MARYPNGGIPPSQLVHLGGQHWLTRATAARWAALVADVRKNEGITLRITPGKNAYRDYAGQVFARNNACKVGRCNDAAVPRTSSHGGEYRGRDSMAIDVDNWAILGRAKFYAYCRKHGFEPGFFDWEPWHIIDWNPWTMPAPSGGEKPKPATKTPEEEDEEDEMAMKGATIRLNGGKNRFILFNEVSGFYVEHSGVDGAYNNSIAQKWGTGSWPTITEAHGVVLKRGLDAIRRTVLSGSVSADLSGEVKNIAESDKA